MPLPPVKWDRHGVRWVPAWENGVLMWGSDGAEVQMTLTHRALAERGPFTEERTTMSIAAAQIEHLRVERDYYRGLVERQQAEIERLRRNLTPGTPEYEALMERLAEHPHVQQAFDWYLNGGEHRRSIDDWCETCSTPDGPVYHDPWPETMETDVVRAVIAALRVEDDRG